jgi:hypothetical protein
MNICSVIIDVLHSNLMKLDAFKRQSEGYFFEVNSILSLKIDKITIRSTLTHQDRYSSTSNDFIVKQHFRDFGWTLTYPIKQKLSKKPISFPTSFYDTSV